MVTIPGGGYVIGYEGPEANVGDDEGPVRRISLPEFQISKTTVTNADFARFVAATGYVTDAEALGWSFVFAPQMHPEARVFEGADATAPEWWLPVAGASWQRPDGPGSTLLSRADHPVVHVSHRDAEAFAAYHGKRLPTEAEWEVAARGGLDRAIYAWGNALHPNGIHMCNIWQGRFPDSNTGEDGWLATAPAESFPANGYGLFNMLGNVWEWTASPWRDDPAIRSMRGGSYLCHASYCNRYRVSARTSNHVTATSSHLGFRLAG
ncbi:formylglycine-generating enzyme family protein [Pseudooceanicola sp. 200-1SW]|uniref:formylglycine-generating enzyme family protein n=1 Tax=Pseudooceanicola sp. 200-1SW TaxID=3425949 RepID=UPI003D7F8C03